LCDLARDVSAFLTDRQARGLSPRTADFYRDELANLANFLREQGVTDTEHITAMHLRAVLLHLRTRRSPGGIHAGYRAASVFLRWYEAEYEPDGWTNPILKVTAPTVPQEPLPPVDLAHVKAILDTCRRRTFSGDRDRAIMLALMDRARLR
jgi:site-specific recombinase XerD